MMIHSQRGRVFGYAGGVTSIKAGSRLSLGIVPGISDNPEVIAHGYFGVVDRDSEDRILRPRLEHVDMQGCPRC